MSKGNKRLRFLITLSYQRIIKQISRNGMAAFISIKAVTPTQLTMINGSRKISSKYLIENSPALVQCICVGATIALWYTRTYAFNDDIP